MVARVPLIAVAAAVVLGQASAAARRLARVLALGPRKPTGPAPSAGAISLRRPTPGARCCISVLAVVARRSFGAALARAVCLGLTAATARPRVRVLARGAGVALSAGARVALAVAELASQALALVQTQAVNAGLTLAQSTGAYFAEV